MGVFTSFLHGSFMDYFFLYSLNLMLFVCTNLFILISG